MRAEARRFVAISDYIDQINRVGSVHEHYTRLVAGLDPKSPSATRCP